MNKKMKYNTKGVLKTTDGELRHRFIATFGEELGLAWFGAGLPLMQAMNIYISLLQAETTRLKSEIQNVQRQIKLLTKFSTN